MENLKLLKVVSLFAVISIASTSCVKYKPKLSGNDILFAHEMAKTCAKEEKKTGRIPEHGSVTSSTRLSKTKVLVKCGGFIDKCHYKVNLVKKYPTGTEEIFDSITVFVCNDRSINQ